MSEVLLEQAQRKMVAAGVSDDAVRIFTRYYRQLEAGESGLISEQDIEPVRDLPRLAELNVDAEQTHGALAHTVVIKLNGGLATSMGLDRAKSLLSVKDGKAFLDIIAEQTLALRERHDVPLPLILMNSFRTRDDSLQLLDKYPALAVDGLPVDFVQSREPKLRADDLGAIDWPADPSLEWCPPGHADVYPSLRATGLLDQLLSAGYRWAFISNADNLGATVDSRIPAWMSTAGLPLVMECCVRTPAERKGGHLAVRPDGRLVLRESAQTPPEDAGAMQDLDRHRFFNTNNLWINLTVLSKLLDERDGVLELPMIRNSKTVDPADSTSPPVIQIESAMGSAISAVDGAVALIVERDRFLPVKTTDDLLLLRSDVYALDDASIPVKTTAHPAPFVELDPKHFKLINDFERHFPDGPPSLVEAERLVVHGDVTFGGGVRVVGAVTVDADTVEGGIVAPGTVLR